MSVSFFALSLMLPMKTKRKHSSLSTPGKVNPSLKNIRSTLPPVVETPLFISCIWDFWLIYEIKCARRRLRILNFKSHWKPCLSSYETAFVLRAISRLSSGFFGKYSDSKPRRHWGRSKYHGGCTWSNMKQLVAKYSFNTSWMGLQKRQSSACSIVVIKWIFSSQSFPMRVLCVASRWKTVLW